MVPFMLLTDLTMLAASLPSIHRTIEIPHEIHMPICFLVAVSFLPLTEHLDTLIIFLEFEALRWPSKRPLRESLHNEVMIIETIQVLVHDNFLY